MAEIVAECYKCGEELVVMESSTTVYNDETVHVEIKVKPHECEESWTDRLFQAKW